MCATYNVYTFYTDGTLHIRSNLGFSALLKDTSTGNRTSNLLITKRPLYLLYHCRPSYLLLLSSSPPPLLSPPTPPSLHHLLSNHLSLPLSLVSLSSSCLLISPPPLSDPLSSPLFILLLTSHLAFFPPLL